MSSFQTESIKNARCSRCGKPAEFLVFKRNLFSSAVEFSCYDCLDYFKKVPIYKW